MCAFHRDWGSHSLPLSDTHTHTLFIALKDAEKHIRNKSELYKIVRQKKNGNSRDIFYGFRRLGFIIYNRSSKKKKRSVLSVGN